MGQIQNPVLLCLSRELRMFFKNIFNGWKQNEEEKYFVTCENYLKFKFQCS